MSSERRPSREKGLPPLPGMTMMDALAAHTRSLRIEEEEQMGSLKGSLRSRGFTKSKRKMKESAPHPLPSLSTDITPPYSSQGSPATPTANGTATRGPFTPTSLDSIRSFATGYDPKNPLCTGAGPGAGHHPPRSPSSISRDSSPQATTPRSVTGFMLGTRGHGKSAAPSVRSSATMPEMTGYNDVDHQWGPHRVQQPVSPKREGLASSLGSGLRRKNSSGKLLVNGLSRSLTRMGSVMKRSTSDNNMSSSVSTKRKEWTRKRAATNRQSTVAEAEEMGEGWERVDMQKEIAEGDTSITRPFNVAHDLHVSPDLGDLPPAWLESLKAQGLSEADLLLIAAARHKAAQRPLHKIVKGSTPPPNAGLMDVGPVANHHHARGMSTPTYLVNAGHDSEMETPLINKRFSWEVSPSTPTAPATPFTETEDSISPFRAFRQSLVDSPPKAQAHAHESIANQPAPGSPQQKEYTHPYARTPTAIRSNSPDAIPDDDGPLTSMEETPKKSKRWSDQLRGFQSSFSSLGGDDDWGSQLTLALTGESGLQTVHEVGCRGPSMDSRRSDPVSDGGIEQRRSGEGEEDDYEAGNQSTPTMKSRNTKSLSIQPTPTSTTPETSPPGARSPLSPRSPHGTRIRRKPVPGHSVSSHRRSIHSTLSDRSYPSSPPPPWRKEKPSTPRSAGTPPINSSRPGIQHTTSYDSLGTPTKPAHLRSHSQSIIQHSTSTSTESEMEHDIRTPSTNHHFFHSPSSSLSHPAMPRSISEESQFTSVFDHNSASNIPHSEHMLAAFSFPVKSQPPRPDPRYSMPASAGYTESSPPTRGPTPSYGGESESEELSHVHVHIPIAIPAGIIPTTPPRLGKKVSSRRNKAGYSPSPILHTPDTSSTRAPTPSCEGSGSEGIHDMLPYLAPAEEAYVPAAPVTPPRTKPTSSSRRTKPTTGHSPASQSLRQAVLTNDPMNARDTAHTPDERASIALSMLSGSGETDPRSSMTSSLRDSLKDAKVLKAYTRDLSGVDEGISTSTSASGSGSETGSNVISASIDASARLQAAVRPPPPAIKGSISPEAIYDAEPTSYQQPTRRTPPSTTGSGGSSRSSRRQKPSHSPAKTPPHARTASHQSQHQHQYHYQHPFAYRKDSMTSHYSTATDDDPLRALEDAAREIARRTGRLQSISSSQRGGVTNGHGTFSDAEE